jgi:hypothetical protein
LHGDPLLKGRPPLLKKVGGSFAKVAAAVTKLAGGSFAKVATAVAWGSFAKGAAAVAKKSRGILC